MWPFAKPKARQGSADLSDERIRQMVGDKLLAREAALDAREGALIDAFNEGVVVVNVAVAALTDAGHTKTAKLLLDKSEAAFARARKSPTPKGEE